MWFQFLSLLIAFALIGKAYIALANRQNFYAARSVSVCEKLIGHRQLPTPIGFAALNSGRTVWSEARDVGLDCSE